MPFPTDVRVIDTLSAIPLRPHAETYNSFKPMLRDKESLSSLEMPAGYMFKDLPQLADGGDKAAWLVSHMDRFNIDRVLLSFSPESEEYVEAINRHRDRFILDLPVDPNRGMETVRRIRKAKKEFGIRSVSYFPSGCNPQVPINSKTVYPVYACCVEEDLPIFANTGVPGPRFPFAAQHVEHLDEVCWFFPELKFVMRHGAEPWEELAVKLLLKWPNLYYSTSAFAPKYYPKAIIDFANTRGADKVIFAGYFPMGLTYDRIFAELRDVPFRDHVWPKFLRQNALKVLGLPDA